MIDIKFLRENASFVKSNVARRKDDEKLKLVDTALLLDGKWRDILKMVEKLKAEKNRLTSEIAKSKDKKSIGKVKKLNDDIGRLDKKADELKAELRNVMLRIPNIIHESVPYGVDDSENVEFRAWGAKPKFSFKPKDHIELMELHGLADLDRAAKISGSRFYFLKGDLVILQQAILKFALDRLKERGFTLINPPYMIRRRAYESVTSLDDFEDVLYKIDGEDLYLIATSEHPMGSMFMDEVFNEKELPIVFAGISPCFRKEAGSHGKDTKGIFRVHQFNKIEQFIFCREEDSGEWHEKILRNAEELLQELGLHYRVVNICTGDLGIVAAKKYDIEVWLPGQDKYREVVSCSNCTSYQSVRGNLRYESHPGAPRKWVHTLNSTAIVDGRIMIAILENFQKGDGSIEIPKCLHKYAGFKVIK